jgi:16S rRNA (cytosine1402-N4)-methyltransferase
MIKTDYHKTVLISEVLQYLDPQPGKTYIDATFGGGGHTQAILNSVPDCNVIGLDWDTAALNNGEQWVEKYSGHLRLLWGNFASIFMILKKHKIGKVDGILADFGTSQHQIFEKDGFSIYKNTYLDMRMSTGHYKKTASDVVNNYTENELAKVFFELGEERASRKIAKLIVEERRKKRIKTTGDLAELVIKVKGPKRGRTHPATKIFQALRIYVNHELENIESFLLASAKILKNGGRIVCISFHSLEDRVVKHFLKEYKLLVNKGQFEILTPKVITATEDELKDNPSSRSACLRAASYFE